MRHFGTVGYAEWKAKGGMYAADKVFVPVEH